MLANELKKTPRRSNRLIVMRDLDQRLL
ncbi:Protein of unknown function [Gryllus bimaculatus]|nr:Protein of unknown function [Gryllus bimaculatus]